ncbi:unnamed protein product [Prunus armeniaca]
MDLWIWFLSLFIEDLGITNGLNWAFISDKQKGLILAIAHVLPTAEHRMCVRHLYNNFRATHLGLTLKHMLWEAARATTIPWWEAEMEKMKEDDLEAWKWLVQRPPNNWTRSHFHPRMANRRAACGKWKHHVGPRIFKIIEKNKMGAFQCILRLAGEKMYQVSHMYGGEFVIDLAAMSCSCRRWDLCGIPCAHAISSIFHRDENPIEYGGLPPIRPPFRKRQPGRPKILRTKEAAEVQVPAPNPPNPLPPGYTTPAAKLRRAKAAQNEKVGQNEVQAADNGNVGQNDIAPAQTNAAPAQTDTVPIQKKATPTQTQVKRGRGRGRCLWNPPARMSSFQPVSCLLFLPNSDFLCLPI